MPTFLHAPTTLSGATPITTLVTQRRTQGNGAKSNPKVKKVVPTKNIQV